MDKLLSRAKRNGFVSVDDYQAWLQKENRRKNYERDLAQLEIEMEKLKQKILEKKEKLKNL